MSDSIAKLSVVITGDSSPLGRATQQAAGYVTKFESDTSSSLTTVGNAARTMNASFAVASGNIGKLTTLGPLGIAGGLTLGAAAAAKLAYNLALAADAAEAANSRGGISEWAAQWDRVVKATKIIMEVLGRPILDALVNVTETLANILEKMANKLQSPAYRALVAYAKERQRIEEEIIKRQDEADKARAAAQQKWRDNMQSAAANIVKAMRTPQEVFADTVNELREMANIGFIGPETFARAMSKAKEDLLSSAKSAERIKSAFADTRLSAVERGSVAASNLFQSMRAEEARQTALAKDELDESRRQSKLLQEGNDIARKKKPVNFMRSSL
jgi:hypothetical protein